MVETCKEQSMHGCISISYNVGAAGFPHQQEDTCAEHSFDNNSADSVALPPTVAKATALEEVKKCCARDVGTERQFPV